MSPGAPAPPPRAAITVRVEAFSWVNSLMDGQGSGTLTVEEPARRGETVREVLRRVSGRYPRLRQALWDPESGELGEHIEIIVNDAVLGVRHELDSPLEDGDRIVLAGQFIGG